MKQPVLGIRDILVRIRMRIREDQKHTDPEHWYLHLHHFSEDKKSLRNCKQYGRNQGFSYYFCLLMEGFGVGAESVLLTNGSGCRSGRPKKHTDPDPDPQHWKQLNFIYCQDLVSIFLKFNFWSLLMFPMV
jgi:hypothetical protein